MKIQIDDEIRNATAEEVKEIENLQAEIAKEKAAKSVKNLAKLAILEKLGLTEQEAEALLG